MALPPHLEGKTLADNPQNINRNGRPVGSRNRSTIVREIIEAVIDGEMIADRMTRAIVEKALSGDVQAFKELMDSGYGKNTDKQELTNPDGSLTPQSITVKVVTKKD